MEHPSIVQISDYGHTPDGTAYLVMEYLRGENLGHRIEKLAVRHETIGLTIALQLAWQVADALDVAHAEGVTHRDIKPDNLMLVSDSEVATGERIKLLDFGIAKLVSPDGHSANKTDTQAVIGTPLYMSPEQCAGAGGVDAKSDVYSLGCVLFEMLAGRPPFVADGNGRVIGMHLFKEPPLLQELAKGVPIRRARAAAACPAAGCLMPAADARREAQGSRGWLWVAWSELTRGRPFASSAFSH